MPSNFISITGQRLELGLESNYRGQCQSIDAFERLNQLGEGTYGVVYRARNKTTSQVVALKQVRISPDERGNGIPITALREISILRSLKHSNIINVFDVAVGEKASEEIYMVMEYVEQDLANMLDELRVKFTLSQVKCLFRQLLEGLDHLHKNDIIHRDVKIENILLTTKGVLKLADFGMARPYSPRPLTPGVVTIWYRAPELLLGTKNYTPSVDLWSAGLVLAELLQSTPCLMGETEIEQLSLIVKLLGSPTIDDMKVLSSLGCPELIQWRRDSLPLGRADNLERRFLADTSLETVTLLGGCLKWDPQARWTAAEALGRGKDRHAALAEQWWRQSPRAADKESLPTSAEARNGGASRNLEFRGRGRDMDVSPKVESKTEEYVFAFDGEGSVRRPAKRSRPR